jgi:hypothetical protein
MSSLLHVPQIVVLDARPRDDEEPAVVHAGQRELRVDLAAVSERVCHGRPALFGNGAGDEVVQIFPVLTERLGVVNTYTISCAICMQIADAIS